VGGVGEYQVGMLVVKVPRSGGRMWVLVSRCLATIPGGSTAVVGCAAAVGRLPSGDGVYRVLQAPGASLRRQLLALPPAEGLVINAANHAGHLCHVRPTAPGAPFQFADGNEL
jgi:hypothetical protein